MPKTTLLIVLGLLSLALVDSASAQGVVRPGRYQPAYGPTLSPYLQYSRPRVGVLDNYHNFVRPRVELRYDLRAQERQILDLNSNLRQVEVEASHIRESGVAPTGTHSVFMNFSHFYPGASSPGGR